MEENNRDFGPAAITRIPERLFLFFSKSSLLAAGLPSTQPAVFFSLRSIGQ